MATERDVSSVKRGWIPCAERRPESFSTVLLGVAGHTYVDVGFFNGSEYMSELGDCSLIPTHWMPLPEAP